jgi:hypothetical protein
MPRVERCNPVTLLIGPVHYYCGERIWYRNQSIFTFGVDAPWTALP